MGIVSLLPAEVGKILASVEVGLLRSGSLGMRLDGGTVVLLRDHKQGDNLISRGATGTTVVVTSGQALQQVRTLGMPGETLGLTMDLEKNEVEALIRSWCRNSVPKMIEKEAKPGDT